MSSEAHWGLHFGSTDAEFECDVEGSEGPRALGAEVVDIVDCMLFCTRC
jgi:hypothetical protein